MAQKYILDGISWKAKILFVLFYCCLCYFLRNWFFVAVELLFVRLFLMNRVATLNFNLHLLYIIWKPELFCRSEQWHSIDCSIYDLLLFVISLILSCLVCVVKTKELKRSKKMPCTCLFIATLIRANTMLHVNLEHCLSLYILLSIKWEES